MPAGYIVAATGALRNSRDVLTPTQIARHAMAATSDTVIRLITVSELAKGTARARTNGLMTWRFSAKNVRDAVWAASPEFQWDASSWKGIMAYAYSRPSAAVNWHDAADQSRLSIIEYSERWFQCPWLHISAVEGPISGMEYPMIAMENISNEIYDLYNVVTHAIGYMWFPMIVGSNVKPSVGLQLLRQEILGPQAFEDAFRTYIARWAYKHPSPADFPYDGRRGWPSRLLLATVVRGERSLRSQ